MIPSNPLSEREKEVVEQLLQGKSNKLIAHSVGISVSTVEFHLKNIYAKFQVSSRMELVLALGNTIGSTFVLEELGNSTVDSVGQMANNGHESNSQVDWMTLLPDTVLILDKEVEMKKRQILHIANAILWATAIIVAAISDAPTVVTIVLLPALAAASLYLIPHPEADME
jgi:DNA-binding CsgD family transcriptional regulator